MCVMQPPAKLESTPPTPPRVRMTRRRRSRGALSKRAGRLWSRGRAGMTLAEQVIVIMVMGILLVIFIPIIR